VQAQWLRAGEAPANPKACTLTTDPEHCTTFHATDADYAKKLYY
jgi:putative spermidine/putrescine transport system substrate-binding protein